MCRCGLYQVILLSPEILQSPAFSTTLKADSVRRRLAVFCVDECHLVDEWGADFRKAYAEIKDIIPLLPTWSVRVALTATLESGRQTTIVKNALGFTETNVFLDRRDCERHNIDIILRPIQYTISANEFLDLDWLIPVDLRNAVEVPKTILYCETIGLGHRVTKYLQTLLPPSLSSSKDIIVRNAHSMNCSTCKTEILDALYQSGD